ncbi:uncharacterized protein CLAFUR5_09289 [Fulvia fulva]|uniref:Helicase C-terminal domain-containing protein n=1 Tax=Passalora fulva TaxID=5499 RepID=A0A9Q8PGL4_PASFU|nr:uncharacterized protein CLAFUR5_09289 [Fulvia fulva]UJO22037.1 hypothetical protein CLAFUR5_09289 [Fulvia fulva]
MPNILSWLRVGSSSNGTMATGPQPQAHEVIDILNESDDSDDSVTVAQPSKSSTKRKVIDILHSDAEDVAPGRPHKTAKTTMTTRTPTSRNSRTIIDSSRSDNKDEVTAAGKRPRAATAQKQSKPSGRSASGLRPSGMQKWLQTDTPTHGRRAFRELDSDQFQNRLRGPIGWCKIPVYSEPFRSQFAFGTISRSPSTVLRNVRRPSAVQTSTTAMHSRAISDSTAVREDVDIVGETAARRPQRNKARQSHMSAAGMEEESEDELAARPRKGNGRHRGRQSHVAKDDASDFEMFDDSEASGSGSDSIGADSTEEEATRSDQAESELETRPKKKTTKAKSRTKADNNTAPTAKGCSKTAGSSKGITNLTKRPKEWGKGIVESLPPVSDISEIFGEMTEQALSLGLGDAIDHLASMPVRIATICSGTESPLLALEMVRDHLQRSGKRTIEVEHAFSAEIEPFKQAYIERNFQPPVIFADVTEFIEALQHEEPMATTAYGAKARIPGGLQMLIAGTPCVDFSALNSFKKGIDDGGESGEVWNAVRAYAIAERPAIILFENVSGAPWDRMIEDYKKIGYDCAAVRVDTKDFYVPQTRQRGYMVCLDRAKLEAEGTGGASLAWTRLMEKFKRPASSPVSAFLLPNDAVSKQHFRADDTRREVAWESCKITQEQIRQTERLGAARPITNWSESGAIRPPENSQHEWHRWTVPRVNDTIDCNHLRKLLLMYDNRYKDRVYDVSQNVYMEYDNRAFGIVGCLTPSGMFYSTDHARLLAPEEMLRLQGLPLDKMSFTTETHSNIQDLAGNAMSSMVMGAAELSAVIIGYKALLPDVDQPQIDRVATEPDLVIAQPDVASLVESANTDSAINMADMVRRAEQAMRRCFCEGATAIAEQTIQQCLECGHTMCSGCGGNPTHKYRQRPLMSAGRVSPRVFENELRSSLPTRLELFESKQVDITSLLAQAPEDYRRATRAGLSAKFAFQRIIRTHCWTVRYTAGAEATLELVICDPARAEWRLYAHPSKKLPANDPLRSLLQQPVAKASAVKNFFGDSWVVRSPIRESVPLSITGSGTKIASRWNRVKLPDYTQHFLWEHLDIQVGDSDRTGVSQELTGTYRHLHLCGTACDSLYIRQSTSDSLPTYLFLDPTATDDPDKDTYVFSHDVERLDYGVVRQVIARLPPSWRAFSMDSRSGIEQVTRTDLLIDDEWHALPQHELRESNVQLQIQRPQYTRSSTQCHEARLLLSCVLSGDLDMPSQLHGKLTQRRQFEHFAWLMPLMARSMSTAQWSPLPLSGAHCNVCAPSPPGKLWSISAQGDVLVMEDPVTAGNYERAIKARPDPLFLSTSKNDSNLHLDLAINVNTLAHRACARLSSKVVEPTPPLQCEWRFIASAEQPFVFKPFRLRPTEELPHISPDRYDMGVTLFPNQLRMLAWMKSQEAGDGVSFELQEIAEATLPVIGWRAEVRAKSEVQIRGGICADHPGFGKTITSLALIDSHLRESDRATIVRELEVRQPQGLIATAASLIICPPSLTDQWCGEICEKLRRPGKVLKVTKTADLSRFSIQDFVDATIVVASRNVLVSDSYVDRLAAFAAIPGPATRKPRAYEEWLNGARDAVGAHVGILQRKGVSALRRHIAERYQENIDSDRYNLHIPSKRLRGANYVAAKGKGKAKASTTKKATATKLDADHVGSPLFEMFYFNRMLVDEFHQLESKDRLASYSLNADKRWGLSGTPDLGDFQDSAQVASLLGVQLPVGGNAKSVMKASNARKLTEQMTRSERFHAFRESPSEAQHAQIHELHQRFLSTFVRRNVMDFDKKLTYAEHLLPVKLHGDHEGLYVEMFQQIKAQGMRLTRSSKESDRQSRFGSIVGSDDGPEQALSKAATSVAAGVQFDALYQEAQRRIAALSARLPKAIHDARKIEPENFESWAYPLEKGMFGDEAVTKMVMTIIKSKTPKSVENASSSETEKPKKGRGAGKRVMIAKLNELCNDLLEDWRSARYLGNVKETLNGVYKSGPKGGTCCDATQCNGMHSTSIAVSPVCGHVICKQCERDFEGSASTNCPASGCGADMSNVVLLRPSTPVDETTRPKNLSAKLEAILSVLAQVQESKEQAILFVQYESELQLMAAALQDGNISAVVVSNSSSASSQAADFRDKASTSAQKTVIVLNASADTAAGLNLQNANHILFLSPLIRETQYEYDATMAQAVGRARRFGQTKHIHVYRFAALNTIDIDVLEHREKRVDALVEQGAPELVPSSRLSSLDLQSEPKRERTQLVCEDGRFSLRPQSWLEACAYEPGENAGFAHGRKRILGYEDYSSGLQFGRNFTEDEEV